jgi:glucose-1-phosphate adenylyltransferase
MGNYLFEPQVLESALHEARRTGATDFGRDILPLLCASHRVYAYDFAENRVPGLAEYEERAYWRDVGTLAALAAAQQDATGARPRFNLWNPRWPIHGRVQELEEEAADLQAATSAPAWRAAHRDRRTDERVQTS